RGRPRAGPRLPPPGVAAAGEALAPARRCPGEEPRQPRHLLVAADEGRSGQERRRLLRVVLDLDDADRLGEALDDLGAEVAEAEPPATGEGSRPGASPKEFTSPRGGAQAARGHP